jgi:hypothetical protein
MEVEVKNVIKNSSNNKSTTLTNKIIIITNKFPENPNFQQAEEILLQIILEKNGMKYEKIEYENSFGSEINNFLGKLPVLYFNGKIIPNSKIFHFLKDLVVINGGDNWNFNNTLFENLILILRDQLRFANELYYYNKLKEKYTKDKQKNLFSFKKLLHMNKSYEEMSNSILNTFTVISSPKYMHLNSEAKVTEVIKDAFLKLNLLIKSGRNNLYNSVNNSNSVNSLFISYLIYSFLKEDKLLFSGTKIRRPVIENLKNEEDIILSNIGAYYKSIEDNLVKSQNSNTKIHFKSTLEIAKKYSHPFNPKNKKAPVNIQELQAEKSLYHHLFSIAIFCSAAALLFIMTTREKKNK